MNDLDDHIRWRDDVAAYALGALDESERAAVEAHLAECERCRADLRWLAPAVDVLPAAVEQLEPPEGLGRRIGAAVGAKSRAAGPAVRLGIGSPRPGLAAAAAVVALVVGIAGGYAIGAGGDSDQRLVTVPAETLPPAGGATAALVHDDGFWRLDVRDMPELRGGDVYQVWLRHDDRLQPSVLFVPSRGDRATVALPGDVTDADEVLVTREPSGGSREPTSGPLLAAPVSSS